VRGKDCHARLNGAPGNKGGGWHRYLDEGDYNTAALEAEDFKDNAMRSLKVWKGEYPPDLALPDYGGDECVVMVHGEDNFKGWMAKFGEGDFNIHRIFSKGAKDRDASSVRVRGKDCKAVLFSSWRVSTGGLVSDPLVEGDYDTASLEAAGFKDNAMRAMRIWKGEHPMFPNDGPH